MNSDLLFDIESNVRSKLNAIVEELKIGKTDSLQKMSYIVCGDPTKMKAYEIESYLINDELSSLKSSQLSLLWLATDDGVGYDDSDLNELSYDVYDVFNYVYDNIDMYDSYNYSENDFLQLLDRQCWLETTIQECNLFYNELEDEILNKIGYFDENNILVPDLVDCFEMIQFYYIYGKDIESLSYKEYEKHLLYKLTSLIEKEEISENFFSDISSSYESFNHFLDNSDFYCLLPPIYFAKKIMEAEEFEFSFGTQKEESITFASIDSDQITNIIKEECDDVNYALETITYTTIYDIVTYGSYAYNQLSYNNSDQRYDHDLSRFLQYTHTLRSSNEEGTRLWVYTSLKKKLEDKHNTVRSSIEDFIKKEFPEYENSKYNLNAVKAPAKKKNTFSAVKPYVLFPDEPPTHNKIKDNSQIKSSLERSQILKNIKALFFIIPIGLLIIIYAYFGFKSMVYTAWVAPTYPITYSIQGSDGRSLTMIFLPNNKTYIIYADKGKNYLELSLDQMRGVYATNYFWRLWYLDAPGLGLSFLGPLKLRIYPKGAKPVIMETTVLNKYIQGSEKSTLSDIGVRTNIVLLFTDDAVRFEDMWLQKVETDPKLVDMLILKL